MTPQPIKTFMDTANNLTLEQINRGIQTHVETIWPDADLQHWGTTIILWQTENLNLFFLKTLTNMQITGWTFIETVKTRGWRPAHRWFMNQLITQTLDLKSETPATEKQTEFIEKLETEQPTWSGKHILPTTLNSRQASYIIKNLTETRNNYRKP